METVSYFSATSLPSKEQGAWAQQISEWTHRAHALGEPVLPQTREKLQSQFDQDLSVLAAVGEHVIAHITAYLLAEVKGVRWLEVGTMFVHWDHRGQGVGNGLAEQIATHLSQDNLVPTSKNLAAIHAFQAAGFTVHPYAAIPEEVRQGLCYTAPCFTPNGHPLRCQLEHDFKGPCIALIRQPVYNPGQ